MAGSAKTPFPLGVTFTNFPDFTNPTAQADFTTDWNDFSNLMGTTPSFISGFEDYTLPMSSWPGHAHWDASSMMTSSISSQLSSGQTEMVFAVPLYSTNSSAGTPDSQFQAIAAGKDDSVYQGILQSYAADGVKNMVIRLGWEMNLPGTPYYVGDDAQSQADWVKAFQHAYTVLHQEAAALGVSVQIAWNPGLTNYTNANATANLYPGDNYVDIVAADVYSDMYPYNDSSSSTPQYHDWDTGSEDTSLAQFMADPVNREHYWNYPAANEWSLDGSGGHSLSLADLMQFAEQHNKPFAIPETGSGDDASGHDVQDDPTFPQ